MNQRNPRPVCGHSFTRFLSSALAALLLTAVSAAAQAEKINLNTADAETLQYIPGIGPSKSADIVRLREETGGFKVMEDLLAVPGIGAKTLLDLKKFGALDSGVSTLTEEMQANPPSKAVSGTGGSSTEANTSG